MTTAKTVIAEVALGPTLAECIDDYRLSLQTAGKSRATREVYTLALQYLDTFLAEEGMPRQSTACRARSSSKASAGVKPWSHRAA